MNSGALIEVDACDVEDKEALASFRACRKRWYEWLIGDDEHSISTQITTMIWDDAIFRTLNEARRFSLEHSSPQKGLNADLLDLLDRGFVTSQVMALRRLTDPGFHDPRKGVVSLTRLLADIEANLHLVTRENYICFDGMPFEAPSPKEVRNIMRDRMQLTFDSLSGKSPTCRSRQDVVRRSTIRQISQSLEICGELREYANKFIAHAAEPSEVRHRVREETRITLEKFDLAYRVVVRAGSFVGLGILFEHNLGEVPTPQYSHLENLDKPMVLPQEMDALDAFWQKRVEEVGSWSENLLRDVS